MARRVLVPERESSGVGEESDRSDSSAKQEERLDVRAVPLDDLRSCPTNPRKVFLGLQELGESLRVHGQIEPVVVRPLPDGAFEVVVGERRFRAAKLAGLPSLVAVVRELTDRQVLELQIAENNLREDVHPLEEADAFTRLHALHGVPVPEIAAKYGRSEGYIRGRMRLATLHDEVKKAFLGDKLGPQATQVAFYLSRVPQQFQPDALKAVLAMGVNGEISASRVQAHLLGQYTLRLETAPFDPRDAKLTSAGACTACPKRSGNDRLLFPDVTAKETCTDPACFSDKRRAGYEQKAKQATESGRRVLTAKECAQLFERDRLRVDAPFVDLDDTHYGDSPDPKQCRTWRAIFGKRPPETVLARDDYGAAHDLLPRGELHAALKAAGATREAKQVQEGQDAAKSAGAPQGTTKDGLDRAAAEKQRREAEATRDAVDTSLADVADECSRRAPGDAEVWSFVLRGVLDSTWDETAKDVAVRRGIVDRKVKKADAKGAILEQVAAAQKLGSRWVRSLVVELLAARSAYSQGLKSESFARACQAFGVDFKAHLKEARKSTRDAAEAKRGKRPRTVSDRSDTPPAGRRRGAKVPEAPASAKEESKGPACRVCGSRGDAVAGFVEGAGKPICLGCDGLEAQVEDAVLYLDKRTENAVVAHFAEEDREEDDYTVGVFAEERTAAAVADLKAQGRLREEDGKLKTKKRRQKPTKFRRSAKVR